MTVGNLQGVTGELQRLTSAIAAGGDVPPALVGAIRERETRRTRLQTQLAAMTEALAQAAKAPANIENQLRSGSASGGSCSAKRFRGPGRSSKGYSPRKSSVGRSGTTARSATRSGHAFTLADFSKE